jgi:hypothetical protein
MTENDAHRLREAIRSWLPTSVIGRRLQRKPVQYGDLAVDLRYVATEMTKAAATIYGVIEGLVDEVDSR